MLLLGAVVGTAKAAIEGLDLVINGVPVTFAALRGQSYVFAVADALGGLRDTASGAGPVVASAVALSSGWLGSATGTGFANAPPLPFAAQPMLAPGVGVTGFATATAVAGRGATVATASSAPSAVLAHLAAVVLDPRGSGNVSASLRAFGRFLDGTEREFWRASVSLASDPEGNAQLTVIDPLNLLRASQFSRFRLRDGSTGSRLADGEGIDLTVPIAPAILNAGPARPFEVRFEAQTDAAVATRPLDKPALKRLTHRVATLTASLPRERALDAVRAWVSAAGQQLRSGGGALPPFGVAAHLLRQGRAAAIDATRVDLARQINRILREVTGVAVRLPDLLAIPVVGDDEVSALTPTRLEVSGDDSLDADRIVVGVEVNGRPADAVAFTMQPSITDGTSQGRLSWAFGTRRPGDAGCASCASDLGLTRGQNRIEVTIADARSGAVVGAAEALVVGRTDLRSAFVPTARRAHGRTRRR